MPTPYAEHYWIQILPSIQDNRASGKGLDELQFKVFEFVYPCFKYPINHVGEEQIVNILLKVKL